MSPSALIVRKDGLAQKWSNEEWQGFSVFPEESPNPNPNFNSLVKKADLLSENSIVSPGLSGSSVKEESFRMVLQPAMSPPRDLAVPLPIPPKLMMKPRKKLGSQESVLSRFPEENLFQEEEEGNFKCNAFCLSLPGFGKPKPVRSPKREDSSVKKKMIKTSSFSNSTMTASCGSWDSSSTVLAEENSRLYFDLPMEMIRFGGRGEEETPASGFLSDKERGGLAVRSVLKTRSSLEGRKQRGSAETSPRRVRFSTTTSVSCPTSPRSCVTPRLLKARDDFNAFLAAQNT